MSRDGTVGPSRLLDAIINPGERLLEWAWRRGRDGLPLRDLDRRRSGVNVHRAAEILADGGRPRPELAPADERQPTRALVDWWDRARPEVVARELRIVNPDLGMNGVIDLVVGCRGCPACTLRAQSGPDGELGVWIIDWKVVAHTGVTCKEKWHFQAGACYRALWDGQGGPRRSCGACVVMLPRAEGEQAVTVVADAEPAHAWAAAEWHRCLAQLRARNGMSAG
jgi:hypothetical protein